MANEGVIGRETIANALNFILNKCRNTFAIKAVATQSANGLMSAADKKKLDGISDGIGVTKVSDVQIPVSAWKEEATDDGYRYAASISLPGVTADHVPIITFADEDVDYFYPTAQTGAGTVTVWADDIPDGTVTVKSIVIL